MKRIVSGIMLSTLLMGTLMLVFNVQRVRASGTIYIKADGSIDPQTANITSADNVTYHFTGNNYDEIVVQRNNIIIDGNGYILQGSASGKGLDLSYTNNVTIRNIEIKRFGFGVYFSDSSNITIIGNNITENNELWSYGIWLYTSSNNSITGNNIANNWLGINLEYSSNNSISGNNIANNVLAIRLWGSSNNSITGNNITANNGEGIWLYTSSNNNSITGNNIANNQGGIAVGNSSNNSITGNNITANNWLGIGLFLFSSNNSISGNNIANNVHGIVLGESSNNNSISKNNIANNEYGIWIYMSSSNIIYHNNFIDNTQQVYIPESGYASVWDDSYPSGGNYWSDYMGIDFFSGPYQNETGSDGIGDTPYIIDENNADHYPLMKPYGGNHDVGLRVSVSPSKTVIGKGYSTTVVTTTVTIINYGEQEETFNFTYQTNTTLNKQTLTLASRKSTTLAFTWNITSLVKGNYTMNAYADPVFGEKDIEDNCFNGWFFITIPGDVNGDKTVNILDCIMIANHFGHVNGNGHIPNTKPWLDCMNCNINCDGTVNILDCIILAGHFGQRWT